MAWKEQGQEEVRGEARLQKQGEYGVCLPGGNNRVKGLEQTDKGIDAEQETGDLEPEVGFRGGK